VKILLLGEYSALHKNLKEGLIELGHEAIVAGFGDSFKKVPVDVSFNSDLYGIFGKVHQLIKPLLYLPSMKGYDVVQLINPFLFHNSFYFPNEYFYNKIQKENKKFFLLAAGDDAYFWKYGRKKLRYGPFDDILKYDYKRTSHYMELESSFEFNRKIVNLCNGVIPIMYEYELSYEAAINNLCATIPIPINTNVIKFSENTVKSRLVIFHGLNRYGFKGTRHVEVAFDYLRKKYPNDLELIIDGKMPINEYLKILNRSNVVIDQVYSYSLGLNGIYAMAMGKVVMGGAEPESLTSLGVKDSPAINLYPSPNSIIEQVENLLDSRYQVVEIGRKSRVFAEKIHGHVNVAKRYIKTWGI
jgi:hypothetical protein